MKKSYSFLMKSVLVACGVLTLSSCFAKGGSKDNSTTPTEDNGNGGETPKPADPIVISSVKTAMQAFNQTTNYSFKVVKQTSTGAKNLASYKFSDNFVGQEGSNLKDTDLYIKDVNGIYRLRYDTDYISGEYLKDESGNACSSLYDNKVVKTLYGVESSYVNGLSATENNLTVSSKAYKIAFIQVFGFASTYYSNVTSLKATYGDNTFRFLLTLTDGTLYTYTLCDYETTISTNYNTFVGQGGTALTLSSELATFRSLIQTNNFYQNLFYFDTEIEGNGTYYLRYGFAPHYFYTYSLSDSSSMQGYIEGNSTELDLYGVYLFTVTNNKLDTLASENPLFTRPDIVTFQHYPSLLKLLSNMEYIKSGALTGAREDFKGSNKYYFNDKTMIADFVKNFSLDQSSFVDYPCAGVEIEINLNYANPANNNIAEPVMCFHYLFNYQNVTYDYPFPMFGFGRATITAFDNLYTQLNPAK